MLATHKHVAAASNGEPLGSTGFRVWLDDEEISSVALPFKLSQTKEINAINAATSSAAILAILGVIEPWFGNLPGPNGLVGGYPVMVRKDQIELNLPNTTTQTEAITWNALAIDEGAVFQDGKILFNDAARGELRLYSEELAAGFSFADLDDAISEFVALRNQLSKIK